MFRLRICRSGLSRQWNKVIQRNKTSGASFSQSPETAGGDTNKPQLDVSFRNMNLPHTLSSPMLEDLPEIKKAESFLLSVFPQIVDDIKTTPEYKEIPESMERLMKVLRFNIPDGRRHRSIGTFNGYRLLMEEEQQKPSLKEMEKAAKCCWSIELINWFVCTLDDIIDDSPERRKRPTWFKMPGVGLPAINDAVMVEMYIYDMIKRYFDGHPSYVKLIELYHRAVYMIHLGQNFDMMTKDTLNKTVRFEMFNMEKHRYLVKYKTSQYTYTNNLEMALALANKYDPRKVERVQPILEELGYFFQIYNDCQDLYRNQGQLITDDKVFLGTDIPLGKMTWFAIRVLERGSSDQKKIIYDHYGKENRESVEKVLKVYHDMELVQELAEYEEKSFNWVCDKTIELNNVISNDFFHYLIVKTYRRDPYLRWDSSK